MLRIWFTESPDERVTLRLEGRLVGPWVAELRRSCEHVLRRNGRLTLDLGNLSFVDGDGVALVRSLAARDVTLLNCSAFVATQLREA